VIASTPTEKLPHFHELGRRHPGGMSADIAKLITSRSPRLTLGVNGIRRLTEIASRNERRGLNYVSRAFPRNNLK
jgi:hypothetical protein